MENKNFAVVAGIFLGLVMSAFIALQPSEASTNTIFLVNGNTGDTPPEPCTGNLGLVLAQNITDLCDVVVILPDTNQLLQYNGTHWVNVDSSSLGYLTDVNANNNGNPTRGIIISGKGSGGGIINFGVNGVNNGTGLSMDLVSGKWRFNNTAPESTDCTLQGFGSSVCIGGNIDLKGFLAGNGVSLLDDGIDLTYSNTGVLGDIAGSGISVNQTTGNVLITNTAQESTSASNVGNGANVFKNMTSAVLYFKTLLVGSGISVSNGTNTITFTNTAPESTVCSNTGSSLDASICNGGNVALKGFKESTGIDIVNNTNDITIKTKFANGTGISITGTTTQTFTNTGVTSLTSANSQISLNASSGNVLITPKYQLLCQNTWSSGQSFSCSSFTAKTYLHVEIIASHANAGTGIQTALQFNSDTGNNYADRLSVNGAADTTGTTRANCRFGTAADTEGGGTYTLDITNVATKDKELRGQGTGFLNRIVGTAPTRMEYVCNWVNTSNQITTITVMANSGNDNYDSNAKITVWGYD